MDRKKILIVCSWLDVNSSVGVFFWEQAKLLEDVYDIKLCVFKKALIGRKKFLFNYPGIKISKKLTPNSLEAYIIEYPNLKFFNFKISNFFFIKSIKLFNKYLSTNEKFVPDLVHAQSVFNAGFVAYYLKAYYKIPYIFTEHNQFNLKGRNEEELLILDKTINEAEFKTVVSLDKVRQFASNGFFFDFLNIGNFVDENVFYPNDNNINNEFQITTLGAFHPLKNQETIFKALDLVDKKIKQKINFTWLGYGAWNHFNRNKLEELINTYKFENISIKLVEKCSRVEVAAFLRESDLFLFSSISEGMPVSVLESLASGVPVCTTNCGGVDEIINQSNGKLIKLFDYEEMARFTLDVINKKVKFDKQKISEQIILQFGSSNFKKKLQGVYNRVLQIYN
ncbi:MAG: glycosyltransferase [Flavobacteriaceae bacterium]|nr:glycosyltransferase [Flavobacteriaceae bacterium]